MRVRLCVPSPACWFWPLVCLYFGVPGGTTGKESVCQCSRRERCRFSPWVVKIPWRRKWQSTPVFLLGEFHQTEEPGGLQSMGSQSAGHD